MFLSCVLFLHTYLILTLSQIISLRHASCCGYVFSTFLACYIDVCDILLSQETVTSCEKSLVCLCCYFFRFGSVTYFIIEYSRRLGGVAVWSINRWLVSTVCSECILFFFHLPHVHEWIDAWSVGIVSVQSIINFNTWTPPFAVNGLTRRWHTYQELGVLSQYSQSKVLTYR